MVGFYIRHGSDLFGATSTRRVTGFLSSAMAFGEVGGDGCVSDDQAVCWNGCRTCGDETLLMLQGVLTHFLVSNKCSNGVDFFE